MYYRFEVINLLIQKYNLQNYLEIGMADPTGCFNNINAPIKHSVDPGLYWIDNQATYKTTSDEFFENLGANKLDLPHNYKWDIIFIDGLHTGHQVLKDVMNSLNHLERNGFIVLHDSNPPFPHMSTEFPDLSPNGWCGTVWKAVYYLNTTCPFLKLCTIEIDFGVTVITRGNSEVIPNFNPMFEYSVFEKNKQKSLSLIKNVDFENWLEKLKEC